MPRGAKALSRPAPTGAPHYTLMDTSTPPPVIPAPQTSAFAHQAAKGSWVCPVLFWASSIAGGLVGINTDGIALLLMVVGLILGIIALFGIHKHGAKGILTPALVGIAPMGC